MTPRKKIGELLMAQGVLDEANLKKALGHQIRWGGKLGQILLEMGAVRPESVAQALATQAGLEYSQIPSSISDSVVKRLPSDVAQRLNAVVIGAEGSPGAETFVVAIGDPWDAHVQNDLRARLGRVRVVVSPEEAIAGVIRRVYLGQPDKPVNPENDPSLDGSGSESLEIVPDPVGGFVEPSESVAPSDQGMPLASKVAESGPAAVASVSVAIAPMPSLGPPALTGPSDGLGFLGSPPTLARIPTPPPIRGPTLVQNAVTPAPVSTSAERVPVPPTIGAQKPIPAPQIPSATPPQFVERIATSSAPAWRAPVPVAVPTRAHPPLSTEPLKWNTDAIDDLVGDTEAALPVSEPSAEEDVDLSDGDGADSIAANAGIPPEENVLELGAESEVAPDPPSAESDPLFSVGGESAAAAADIDMALGLEEATVHVSPDLLSVAPVLAPARANPPDDDSLGSMVEQAADTALAGTATEPMPDLDIGIDLGIDSEPAPGELSQGGNDAGGEEEAARRGIAALLAGQPLPPEAAGYAEYLFTAVLRVLHRRGLVTEAELLEELLRPH
jgi:hypothetical protein